MGCVCLKSKKNAIKSNVLKQNLSIIAINSLQKTKQKNLTNCRRLSKIKYFYACPKIAWLNIIDFLKFKELYRVAQCNI